MHYKKKKSIDEVKWIILTPDVTLIVEWIVIKAKKYNLEK